MLPLSAVERTVFSRERAVAVRLSVKELSTIGVYAFYDGTIALWLSLVPKTLVDMPIIVDAFSVAFRQVVTRFSGVNTISQCQPTVASDHTTCDQR